MFLKIAQFMLLINVSANMLKGLGTNPDTLVIGGFSSGAQMSQQLHVIYSGKIKGAGLANGGLYATSNAGVNIDIGNIGSVWTETTYDDSVATAN